MMGTLHHCLRAALGGHVARLRHWCRQGVRLPIEMQPGFYRLLRAGPHGWSSAAAEAEAEAEAEELEQEQEQAVLARISAACVRYSPVASRFFSSPLLSSLSSLSSPCSASSSALFLFCPRGVSVLVLSHFVFR